jgi:hypothetical protein
MFHHESLTELLRVRLGRTRSRFRFQVHGFDQTRGRIQLRRKVGFPFLHI